MRTEYNISDIRERDANVPIPIYPWNELWTEVIRGRATDRSYTSLRRVKDELELSLVGMRFGLGRGELELVRYIRARKYLRLHGIQIRIETEDTIAKSFPL
jgi:hypothetical protein